MTTPERLRRTELLLGAEALARLRAARVTVAGLGAVGSYAVEALARAGIGHLCLVDFDTVQPSNLNRQLFALGSTLGRLKTEVAAERVRDIAPDCTVEIRTVFINAATAPTIAADAGDYLVDAIDSLGPKVELLVAAVAAGRRVIASMGAATRTDPLAIRVGDLARTEACPLARFVRKRLRARGITAGIRCVYSIEPSGRRGAKTGVGEPDPTAEPRAADAPGGRIRRPLGSLSCITGMFGLIAAREVIMALAGPRAESPA